jgi:ABC-type antimicrobial peptide transport system permease subunit
VFQRGLLLSFAGTGVGLAVAVLVMRVLRDKVFGLKLPSGWFLAAVVIAIVIACACVIAASARRVVGIDPMRMLRDA